MTWYELTVWFDGQELKERKALELEAWACANVMNCWTKKRITMNRLIGPRKGVVDVMSMPPDMPVELVHKLVEATRKESKE